MARYEVEVHAYQIVEVEANSEEEAIEKAIEEGVDLSSCEWSHERCSKIKNE
ncbi:MAG: hypothetical protein K0R54_2752 [Clostridiaceae bacterium]|jgi:predicted peroxiredoxin|nr:hypothetical protein [Clostridiaceae bacterium]MDF2950470.1 hypothetical protein [Anaerocolumna sp.]